MKWKRGYALIYLRILFFIYSQSPMLNIYIWLSDFYSCISKCYGFFIYLS